MSLCQAGSHLSFQSLSYRFNWPGAPTQSRTSGDIPLLGRFTPYVFYFILCVNVFSDNWSDQLRHARAMLDIRSGMVWINQSFPIVGSCSNCEGFCGCYSYVNVISITSLPAHLEDCLFPVAIYNRFLNVFTVQLLAAS